MNWKKGRKRGENVKNSKFKNQNEYSIVGSDQKMTIKDIYDQLDANGGQISEI